MGNEARAKKGSINMIASSAGTLIMGFAQLASRIIFIRFLSDEYLGISSLLTNIMSILSLTELGVGSAVAFALYRPLAEADTEKIKSIMRALKKAYVVIGLVIVCFGAVLFPFLPSIINNSSDLSVVNMGEINLVFALYVLQVASSYWFFSYKGILLQADQKLYITKAYIVSTTLSVIALQLITLAIWRNFILYSLIGFMTNIIVNILVARKVDKLYPYINDKQYCPLKKEEKKELFKNVFGMSLFKINNTVIDSTDNILITAFFSLKMVALYGNYQILITGISQVCIGFFSGITATVGNFQVSSESGKDEFVFRCIQFLSYWVYTFVAIGILLFIDPVIGLFFGESRLLSKELVVLQVLYFVINGFQRTSYIYRDACGLFWKGKMRPAVTSILNIVISILLVTQIGLAGVIWGTIISWLLTTLWYDPILIYRNVFHKSAIQYFLQYAKAFLLFGCLAVVTVGVSSKLSVTGFTGLLVNGILVIIIPNLGYYLVYRNTEEFIYAMTQVKKLAVQLKICKEK